MRPIAGWSAAAIDRELFRCDAVDFAEAVVDDPGRAIDLYAGPLMKGFYLSRCIEFEQWLDAERARLAQLALEAYPMLSAKLE